MRKRTIKGQGFCVEAACGGRFASLEDLCDCLLLVDDP